MLREMNIREVFAESSGSHVCRLSLLATLHEGAVLCLLAGIVDHAVRGGRFVVKVRSTLSNAAPVLGRRRGWMNDLSFFLLVM